MNADERRWDKGEELMVDVADVSFVVPTYNSADTVVEALASIRAQTVPTLEVVVVDDASTDNTCELVEHELTNFSSARLVRMDRNGGPAASRNRGVQEATGSWIAFLDADDLCVPDRIERQMAYARDFPDVGMICGRAVRVSAEATLDPSVETPEPARGSAARRLLLEDFVENNQVATSTVLVRRDVLQSVGGFDTQFRGPEDLDLWLRIAACHKVAMMDAPMALYRHVPGSLSMDPDRFLPQVLGVLSKAFSDGGALSAHPEWRRAAESTQLWNAAWMAFSRGRRMKAAAYWCRAYGQSLHSSRPARRKWFRILLRYLFGSKP